MSKMSQLAAELDELRHCGEILIGISDTLREMFSGGEETAEAQETPAEKQKGKTKAAKTAPTKEPEKPAEPEKQLIHDHLPAETRERQHIHHFQGGTAHLGKGGACTDRRACRQGRGRILRRGTLPVLQGESHLQETGGIQPGTCPLRFRASRQLGGR